VQAVDDRRVRGQTVEPVPPPVPAPDVSTIGDGHAKNRAQTSGIDAGQPCDRGAADQVLTGMAMPFPPIVCERLPTLE
jgi:hypothetical protein